MTSIALPPPAFLLPRSPAAAVLLILVALAVTYALLNVFVRVGVNPEPTERWPEPEPAPPDAPREAPPPGIAPPMEHEGDADLAEHAGDADPVVQAIRVRGIPLAVGDTSSQVMRAFRPGEGERLPMIERLPGGMASRVVRSYMVGTRALVLMLERSDSEEPLRVTHIEVQGG
jgi:hypothetical protein